MGKVQLVSSLPQLVNRISPYRNSLFLNTDNAIFELKLQDNIIYERGRWTGAFIQNVEIVNSAFIVGTDKGLILFDGSKQLPVWTGDKTLVLSGKFGKETVGFALTLYNNAGRKYLKPNPVTLDVVEGKKKKLWTADKIPFFTPYGGLLNDYLVNYILGLTHTLDVDGDGFDELVMITPSIENSYLLIIKVNEEKLKLEATVNDEGKKEFVSPLEVNPTPLPPYTFRPIYSVKKDIDLDGFDEVVLLSKPEENIYTISMIKFPLGRPDIQTIYQFHAEDLFEDITDDGEIWFGVGDINGDGALELILVWEEKPDIGELYSKFSIVVVDFFGEIAKSNEVLQDYPISQLLIIDADGDGSDEIVTLNPLGISIWNLENNSDGSIAFQKNRFIPLMEQIQGLDLSSNGSIFAFGPVISTSASEEWVIYEFKNQSFKVYPSLPIFDKIIEFKGEIFIKTRDNQLLEVSNSNVKSIMDKVVDAVKFNEKLIIGLDSGELIAFEDVAKKPKRLVNLKGKFVGFSINSENLYACAMDDKNLVCKDVFGKAPQINLTVDDKPDCLLLENAMGKTFVIISYDNSIEVFDDHGNVLLKVHEAKITPGKFTVLRDNKETLILILNNGFLYAIRLADEVEYVNVGFKAWNAILKKTGEDEFYIAYRDGIYLAEKEEIFK